MWVVERIDVDGEELPIIRHKETWLPVPIALRYMLRTRFNLGPASLATALRAVTILYNWAEATEGIGYFEDFLTSGHVLNRDQLLTFIPYLQKRPYYDAVEDENTPPDHAAMPMLVSNHTFNTRLAGVREFLVWSIEPTNHGGEAIFDEDERDAKVTSMVRVFGKETLPVGESDRGEPLTIAEIKLIRRAIAPDEDGTYPPNVFTEATRYRNWVMFESALNLGARISELLTLKLMHLPANKDGKFFLIPRQQDAPEDPRKRRRPRGKTSPRRIPLMNPNILPSILGYRDAAPPLGRNHPRITTPYFFVTKDGQPVSISTANYIIKQIGRYAVRLLDSEETFDDDTRAQMKESLLNLSWHRLRHTWAEIAALHLYHKYDTGAWAILKEWGGWRSDESMHRYIEYARRTISEQAAREYISSFNKES